MKILFINNDGRGFADYLEVAEGITIATLFAERLPHGRAHDYLIRVNQQPVSASHVLTKGIASASRRRKSKGRKSNQDGPRHFFRWPKTHATIQPQADARCPPDSGATNSVGRSRIVHAAASFELAALRRPVP